MENETPKYHMCAKCGNTAEIANVDLTAFLCGSCEFDFWHWCRAMDTQHISYTYDEFMQAA